METTFKSGFKNPITISDAITYIEKRYFLGNNIVVDPK